MHPVRHVRHVLRFPSRDEFHTFGYDDAIYEPLPFKSAEGFLAFLGVPQDHLAAPSTSKFTFSNFHEPANTIAKSLHRSRECILSLTAPLADILRWPKDSQTNGFWCSRSQEVYPIMRM